MALTKVTPFMIEGSMNDMLTYAMIQGSPLNLLDYGADPTGVADSTTAIEAMFADLNSNGGCAVVPTGTYKLGTNLQITNEGAILQFNDAWFDVFNGGSLNTANNQAVITVKANNVRLQNVRIKSTTGVSVTAIRCGDYSYDGSTGTAYRDIVLDQIEINGIGSSGPGCGKIAFAALRNSHAYNIKTTQTTSTGGASIGLYGCIDCSVNGAWDENNGECAYYIGSNQPLSTYSVNCSFNNVYANQTLNASSVFAKISRASKDCSINNAYFYAAGNGTFRAISNVGVLAQSGFHTTFNNVNVQYTDMSSQTSPAFGLYAHADILPLDQNLIYPVMNNCSYVQDGSASYLNTACLLYPTDGSSVTRAMITNCVFASYATNGINNAINIYANDPANGKITDTVINGCIFTRCTYGVNSEVGPSGGASDITNVYLGYDNIPEDTTPNTYWNIVDGTLVKAAVV